VPSATELKTYDDADAYAVYAALMSRDYHPPAKKLIVEQETVNPIDPRLCLLDDKAFRKEYSEAIEDYYERWKDQYRLARQLKTEIDYSLVARQDLSEFFKKDAGGWDAFYKRYPDSSGIFSVSVVGFNRSKTQAILYVSHTYGYQGAWGSLRALYKLRGNWIPDPNFNIAGCGSSS